MTAHKPPFTLFLIVSLMAGGAVFWLPFGLGGLHDYQDWALFLSLLWVAWFALGLRLYGRRGWWLLLASPPAFYWLFVTLGAVVCARGCG